jgi:hypothetical protein
MPPRKPGLRAAVRVTPSPEFAGFGEAATPRFGLIISRTA